MATLDSFLPPRAVKPVQDPGVFVEERCANPVCRKVLKISEPKFWLVVEGERGVYCGDCTRVLLPKVDLCPEGSE